MSDVARFSDDLDLALDQLRRNARRTEISRTPVESSRGGDTGHAQDDQSTASRENRPVAIPHGDDLNRARFDGQSTDVRRATLAQSWVAALGWHGFLPVCGLVAGFIWWV